MKPHPSSTSGPIQNPDIWHKTGSRHCPEGGWMQQWQLSFDEIMPPPQYFGHICFSTVASHFCNNKALENRSNEILKKAVTQSISIYRLNLQDFQRLNSKASPYFFISIKVEKLQKTNSAFCFPTTYYYYIIVITPGWISKVVIIPGWIGPNSLSTAYVLNELLSGNALGYSF